MDPCSWWCGVSPSNDAACESRLGDHQGGVDAISLAAMPIWRASTAMLPSIYMNTEYNSSVQAEMIRRRVNASVALARMVAAESGGTPMPVFP